MVASSATIFTFLSATAEHYNYDIGPGFMIIPLVWSALSI